MQDIAREGATAQDGDLGKHDQRGRNLHDPAHGAAPHGKGGAWFLRCASEGFGSVLHRRVSMRHALRRGFSFSVVVWRQARRPAYFSSLAQASSPYFFFHSV
ncbi:hypothetical protein D3C72_1265240 [compost metagenome]